MPHYADGSPAIEGDFVQNVKAAGIEKVVGILVQITASSDSCNGQVLPLAKKYGNGPWYPDRQGYNYCVTLKECLPMKPTEQLTGSAEQVSSAVTA